MNEDEFTKMSKYITERIDKVDKNLEDKANNTDLECAIGLVDLLSKRLEILEISGLLRLAN